jgi:hypothetical protein
MPVKCILWLSTLLIQVIGSWCQALPLGNENANFNVHSLFNTPGRVGDHVPPVRYVAWYLVVRMGVRTAVSSVHTLAVQSPIDRKYLELKGLRRSP